jgi:formate/nitrite transporter FocA (FNT family)
MPAAYRLLRRPLPNADARIEHVKTLQRKASSAGAVHQALLLKGESEINRPWIALAWSGLAAGISMGLSLVAQGALRAHLPETKWRVLITGIGYAMGFLAVTLCLPRTWPARGSSPGRRQRPGPFGPELAGAFGEIAHESVSHGAWMASVKGIFGGWIIALLVWLMPSADTAKPWIIVAMTYVLAVGGRTHIIAGPVDVFFAIAAGDIGWTTYAQSFGLPVLLGNTLGGLIFVAALKNPQVAAEGQ